MKYFGISLKYVPYNTSYGAAHPAWIWKTVTVVTLS
uniref:Uncharacterized protein n=1 Tax=Anguilla anguilla TaxID=7936 RepID=A0A0E9QKW9_ANGAN